MGEYERERTTRRGRPSQSRLRLGLKKRGGAPVRFLVQLEYRHEGQWLPVARFDHDGDGPAYRGVEIVGLHLDVYDPDCSQIEKTWQWSAQPSDEAMGDAETYLRGNAERLIRRFESWL